MPAVLALLLAQIIQPGIGLRPGQSGVQQPAAVAFSALQTPATGLMFTDDANTVSHVYWANGALVDTKGNAWTMNGTVPQVTTGPFFPNGFSQPAKPGAGPFSGSNYYSLPASSPLAFPTGTAFTVCAVYVDNNTTTAYPFIFHNGVFNGSGWFFQDDDNGNSDFYLSANGSFHEFALPGVCRGPQIICGSYDGVSTGYAMADNGVLVSNAAPYAQDTTYGTFIGVDAAGTVNWFPGSIFELWAATGDYHAQFQAIESRAFGMVGNGTVPITDSRSSTATDMIAGTLYTFPANVARIDANGILAEPGTTNLALYSQQFDNAAWTKNSVTVTANTTIAPDTTLTADTLADSAVSGNVVSTTWTAAASPYTVSAWLQTTTGTQAAQLDLYDTTAAATLCTVTPTVTTTATRYSCSLTTNATAGDLLELRLWPGGTAGTGTVVAWGAQGEALAYETSYVGEVLGTAVTRSAEQVNWTGYADGNSGCVGADFLADWGSSNRSIVLYAPDNGNILGAAIFSNGSGDVNFYSYIGNPRVEASSAPPMTPDTWFRVSSNWSAPSGTLYMSVNGVRGTVASGYHFQDLSGAIMGAPNGVWHVRNIVFGNTPGACQ